MRSGWCVVSIQEYKSKDAEFWWGIYYIRGIVVPIIQLEFNLWLHNSRLTQWITGRNVTITFCGLKTAYLMGRQNLHDEWTYRDHCYVV